MKRVIVLVCMGSALIAAAPVLAAGEKMKGCSKEATGMKGDERKAFMKKCLSKDYVLKSDAAAGTPAAAAIPATPAPPATASAQQDRMKGCNAEARAKGLMGEERKRFMSGCLKG